MAGSHQAKTYLHMARCSGLSSAQACQACPLERLAVKVKVRRNVGTYQVGLGSVTSNPSGSVSFRLN